MLASQAKQVFYVKNSNESDWYTIIKMQPWDLYQMSGDKSNGDFEPFQQSESRDDRLPILELVDENTIVWDRNDVLGETMKII